MLEPGTVNQSLRRMVGRRAFLATSGVALAGLTWWHYHELEPAHADPAPSGPPKLVAIVDFTDAGERKGTGSVPMIQKTEAEGKAQLSPEPFEVTRTADTAPPSPGS